MQKYDFFLNNYHTHDVGMGSRLVTGILIYHTSGYDCNIAALDHVLLFQKLDGRLDQNVGGVCALCLERFYAPVNLHLTNCGCARGQANYGRARSPLGEQTGGKSADGRSNDNICFQVMSGGYGRVAKLR